MEKEEKLEPSSQGAEPRSTAPADAGENAAEPVGSPDARKGAEPAGQPAAGGEANEAPSHCWHAMTYEKAMKVLETDEDGLSDEEAARRLTYYGRNVLRETKRKSIGRMIFEQLADVMVIILFIAMVFSVVMAIVTGGEDGLPEAIVIFVVIALNATVGVIQEKKAADALEALKNMTAPNARVLRNGEESIVPASELVPGDIVYLEDGTIVPADIRIINDNNMNVQEASLTGESVPSAKDGPTVLPEDTPLGDRVNMAYSSSIVMYGNAKGIVVGTGMNTEVGKIADMLKTQDDTVTPIKRKLNSVGKMLTVIGFAVCVLIVIIGLIRGLDILEIIFLGISLAISIIPEGLPATATIIMAFGVQRMAKKNALVKSLPAVETLGGATVVCCDKTGTLTLNRMTVTHVAVGSDFASGKPTPAEKLAERHGKAVYADIVDACALCGNAHFDPDRQGETMGDPTEGALINFALGFGIDADDYREAHEKLFEQPFDSERKRMTTVNDMPGGPVAYTKGAVDEMLPLCSHLLTETGVREMTDADREEILALCNDMSKNALRVLGFAARRLDSVPEDETADVEVGMTFVGATGMIDPPRKEVIGAVDACHDAGIRVIMITGDHKVTALAIARQLHIYRDGNTVIDGKELDEMTDEQLAEAVKRCAVFARVSPSDKLRIIRALKAGGEVAAMTGDGVNDSPALKEADIGVAMGVTGTDVAKDAADMILLDDNFTTIEYAIREGRRVYRNIQKVIQFLVAGNIAEILTLFLAVCFGWEEPILAIHILLINLATDSLPAIALGVDPADRNVMKVPPVKSGTLFEKGVIIRIALHGAFITAAALVAYWIAEACYGVVGAAEFGNPAGDKHMIAMTMTFMVLSLSQLVHAINQRSNYDSVFRPGQGHNKFLYGAMAASLLIIAFVSFVPGVMGFFSLVYLQWYQYLIVLALALFPLLAVEISKIFIRLYRKKKSLRV